MALKPQVKQEWLAALRSGEYKQGRGFLCDEKGRMCCLGVVYDAAVDGQWVQTEARDFTKYGRQVTKSVWGVRVKLVSIFGRGSIFEVEEGNLPDPILKRIGLTDDDQQDLIRMNDREKRNFKYIADYIEKNL